LNPNYDVINDVISGFAKAVAEQCVAWMGMRGKVRPCPPVVGIFVGLLSAVKGEDGPGERGR